MYFAPPNQKPGYGPAVNTVLQQHSPKFIPRDPFVYFHTRAAYETIAAHSTSASAVHYRSSRNDDDALFANVFLTTLSARASSLFGRICLTCTFV